jgi:hypothetical protein
MNLIDDRNNTIRKNRKILDQSLRLPFKQQQPYTLPPPSKPSVP